MPSISPFPPRPGMLRLVLLISFFPSCIALGLLPLAPAEAAESSDADVDFARDVLPILSNKCFVCHGPDGKNKDVLRLDSADHAQKLIDGHQAINPDAPAESEVLARIHSEDAPMPPADAEKQLTAAERKLLERWIMQGGQYAVHWSFVPPKKAVPPGGKIDAVDEAIDRFVEAKLKQRKLDFAPEADRPTLARRAALVLTGLPPTPQQLQTFLNDKRANAYEHYVDELLASPHFGEHQARYWLDAVRYGDTHGLHLDNKRAIYPYRDWVIHALNNNLPLDEFIVWQLAGDMLPDATLEQQVATGYVRMNPTTAEGGVIADEFQAKNNFDRVETLGTVFLGMTLTCARCHSHKYDPISQTEYYQLFAFFNSTAEHALDGNKYEYAPVIQAPPSVDAWKQWHSLQDQQQSLLDAAAADIQDEGVRKQWAAADAKAKLAMLADGAGAFKDSKQHAKAKELQQQSADLQKQYVPTLVAKELDRPRKTVVLKRGEYDMPTGDELQPGVPAVMGSLGTVLGSVVEEGSKDQPVNRLTLARWLTSREQPLVARVLVNRLWQRTFGDGLVRTPEDFGLQGEQPTHPQLLDYLAVELQDSGWDLKHMLKLMVTSKTFRQSSAWRKDAEDPENRLLARGPRFRLDAEVIRDMGLWASGLLDSHKGSEGIKPYQPSGLWSALMHPASNTKNYVRDQGDLIYRRSLYVYWKRTCPHPMLTLFDAPSRESSCVRRSRTNTPLQSLGLLNETQRTEMARVLAGRLLTEAETDEARLDLLFTLIACREPSDAERKACVKLLTDMRSRFGKQPADAEALLKIGDAPRDEKLDSAEQAAWTQVAITVLASDLAIILY